MSFNVFRVWPLYLCLLLLSQHSLFAKPPAPEFWISNLERVRFDSRQQSTPYVLSFFFIGCVPCVTEIPALYNWMRSNAPEAKLLFISPLKADSKKDIERYATQLQVPKSYFYSDPFGRVLKKFFPEQTKSVFPTLVGVAGGEVAFLQHALDKETLLALEKLVN